MKRRIVRSAVLSDADLGHLGERLYFRVGAAGTGQPVSGLPLRALDSVLVANHPDYAAATGERHARLWWCDRCECYGPVDEFRSCEGCQPAQC